MTHRHKSKEQLRFVAAAQTCGFPLIFEIWLVDVGNSTVGLVFMYSSAAEIAPNYHPRQDIDFIIDSIK